MHRKLITVYTEKQFYKLTDMVNDFLSEIGGTGIVNIFVQHTTCAIKVLEGEVLLLSDISSYLKELFPQDNDYRHDIIEVRDVPINERINGFAHMRQLFFNSGVSIPVQDGAMMLGKWQDVFLIEFDPVRDRNIVITFYNNSI